MYRQSVVLPIEDAKGPTRGEHLSDEEVGRQTPGGHKLKGYFRKGSTLWPDADSNSYTEAMTSGECARGDAAHKCEAHTFC